MKHKSRNVHTFKLTDFPEIELTPTELDIAREILASHEASEEARQAARITLGKYGYDLTGKKDKQETTEWQDLKKRDTFHD